MTSKTMLIASLLSLAMAGSVTSTQESAEAGSIWKGSLKVSGRKDGKPSFNTHECRLIILERDGETFQGEFWWNNDKSGVKVEGTICKGKVRFTSTGDLRGESIDLVDNVKVQGKLLGKEQKEMLLKFAVPGTNPRTGEIKLKLQN